MSLKNKITVMYSKHNKLVDLNKNIKIEVVLKQYSVFNYSDGPIYREKVLFLVLTVNGKSFHYN